MDGRFSIMPFVVILIGAVYVGGFIAILWFTITRELRSLRRAQTRAAMLQTFGAAQASVLGDPRQLLTWYPLAEAARRLEPEAFADIDAAAGKPFPFSRGDAEQAHARVSSEWLAWEKAHDEEYRIRAAEAERTLAAAASGDAAAVARARLDRIQHEKIERYQQRYEEYIRAGKALQALLR
jgi:hypothetical protein